MGQAKQRGSYEERKAQAIERYKQEHLKNSLQRKHIRPKGKSQLNLLLAMALASSITPPNDTLDF